MLQANSIQGSRIRVATRTSASMDFRPASENNQIDKNLNLSSMIPFIPIFWWASTRALHRLINSHVI